MVGSTKESVDDSRPFQEVFTEGPLEELMARCDVVTAASLVGSSKLHLDSSKCSATLHASQPFGLPCVLHSHPAKIPPDSMLDGVRIRLCKLSPLDRLSSDAVMPDATNKQWAGANGDWIATVGLKFDWELVNVYTRLTIPLPAVPFQATKRLDTFLYDDHRLVLQKIVICQVPTAAGGFKDFCLVALFDASVVFLHGHDGVWIVLPKKPLIYFSYSDAIFHEGLVFAVTEIGSVYAWHPRCPGLAQLLMRPATLKHLVKEIDNPMGHSHECDFGIWWLARSQDGSKLLLVNTRGVAGEQGIYCRQCRTIARPSVVHCCRTVTTYSSGGFGCLVFSKDNSLLLDQDKPWERITNLGAHSLFLGVNYPIIMPVGGADLAQGYLTRSNCVYTLHYAICLFDPPEPEICRFSLNGKDDTVGFSTNTAFTLSAMLNKCIDPSWVKTPLWFIPSFANALYWNQADASFEKNDVDAARVNGISFGLCPVELFLL